MIKTLNITGSHYLIAVQGDQIMGWILLGESKNQFSDKLDGFIYELFVLEEFRGKSISKQLMKTAIDHLKQNGHTEVRLRAIVGNKAIKLDEKMGK